MSTAMASETSIRINPTTMSATTATATRMMRERVAGSTGTTLALDAWPETSTWISVPGTRVRRTWREARCATVADPGVLPRRPRRPARRGRGRVARCCAAEPRRRRHRAAHHQLWRQARSRVRLLADARAEPGPVHALHHQRLRRPGQPDEGRGHPRVLRGRADAG